jgi:type IV secretory pathway VirD2 relaxase
MLDAHIFFADAPASAFLRAAHPFRPRPGRARSDAPAPRLASLAVSLRRFGYSGSPKPRKDLPAYQRNGRGALPPRPADRFRQSVVVKARSVRNGRGAGAPSKALLAHIRYLERDEVGRDGERGRLFDERPEVPREEVSRFAATASQDRHHFRLILSPERGAEIELDGYTRDYVRQLERDLRTDLQWLATAHYNTGNPHVHLILRGVDDRGADLVINRHYIAQGLRQRAEELATLELGPRRESDLERSREAQIRAERFTGIDRRLVEAARANPAGIVSTRAPIADLAKRADSARLAMIRRLHFLESIGLAREVAPGHFRLADGFERELRDRGERRDIIKTLHRRLGQSRTDVPLRSVDDVEVLVQGEVLVRRHEDEISDREVALVHAADGNLYRVPFNPAVAVLDAGIRPGAVVELRPRTAAPTRVTDPSRTPRGRGMELRVLSPASLQVQIRARGVTWIDQQLAEGRHLPAKPRPWHSLPRFERRVRAAMRARLAELERRGLTILENGVRRPSLAVVDALYKAELERTARGLSARHGQHEALVPGQSFDGRVAGFRTLSSGLHAVIADRGRFALVPATDFLIAARGSWVELSALQLVRPEPSRALMLATWATLALEAPLRSRGRSLTR